MTTELEELRITSQEIERLSGLEVSDHFIGGLLWGTYRWPMDSTGRLLAMIATELLMLGVCSMFATLIGAVLSQNLSSNQEVLQMILIVAFCLWLLRQLWMGLMARKFLSCMRLLDELDRYHQVIQAVGLLEQLGSVKYVQHRGGEPILIALSKARESIVAGFITEKVLRCNQGLLSRREALLETIEENLMTLRSLDLQHQAQEYGDILDQALNIGIRVQHEVNKLTR